MWRYFQEAFWARPQIPGLGRVPVNALLFAGFGILGFGHEAFWFMGAGLEAAYLAALVTNERFRAWVDAVRLETAATSESSESQALLPRFPRLARIAIEKSSPPSKKPSVTIASPTSAKCLSKQTAPRSINSRSFI